MWNKFVWIVLAGLLTFSLSAQNYRYSRRRSSQRNQQTVTPSAPAAVPAPAKKPEPRRKTPTADLPSKFDPQKPLLTEEAVARVLETRIRKQLLERKLAPSIRESTRETYLSQSEYNSLLREYKWMANNFELTEVTRVKAEWYQRYGIELEKFRKIVDELYYAMRNLSEPRYAAAVERFQKQQEECLKFLKGRQPRISKEQYEALALKNAKIRQQNYLKRIQMERDAAVKRRQERLKQQEDKLKLQKYLREHPEFFKEHPEFLREHPNFLKEHPEFRNLAPKVQKNQTQNKDQKTAPNAIGKK